MNPRPNPFERLMNDLKADQERATPGRFADALRRDHLSNGAQNPPAKPVSQSDVRAIHAQIDVIAKTAEFCDKALAEGQEVFEQRLVNQLTKAHNRIEALEEAICPRVAARLQSLEKAVVSLQGLATMKATPAPAKPEARTFSIMGVLYTALEARVATVVADGPIRFSTDFKKAREIIALVRAQQ